MSKYILLIAHKICKNTTNNMKFLLQIESYPNYIIKKKIKNIEVIFCCQKTTGKCITH